jgi:hypothetical protein
MWEQQLSYVLLTEKQGMKNPFLSLDKPILAYALSLRIPWALLKIRYGI